MGIWNVERRMGKGDGELRMGRGLENEEWKMET